MDNHQNTSPIGVFDSGVGGISVLAELVKNLPREKYIYLADSANAPYGTKDCEYVREISLNAAGILYDMGVKALVVACNSATSVAINNIRDQFDIPVIGMEPALKPAVEMGGSGAIVVMATPLTLKEEKFNNLFHKFNLEASIIPLPCEGLMELIESEAGMTDIVRYLKGLFQDLPVNQLSTVVLGCTHYCFIRNEISKVAGPTVKIIDGNAGTVRQLERTLSSLNLLAPLGKSKPSGQVEFLTTGDRDRIIPMCERFLQKSL